MGRSNLPIISSFLRSVKGFTLVELLVVLLILGFLIFFAVLLINPLKQLDKVKDSQRQNDIKQIQNALDLYYNDYNCYPASLSELEPKYFAKLPQDPTGTYSYYFMTEAGSGTEAQSTPIATNGSYTSDCSKRQWYALYAASANSSSTSCALENLKDENGNYCLPANYDKTGYNFCATGGKVDCALQTGIEAQNLPTQGEQLPVAPPSFSCTGEIYYYPNQGQGCNSVGDRSNCDFNEGGTKTCYQNRSGDVCEDPVCTSWFP